MRYAWARGLGRKAVAITAALAVVLVLLVIAMVWLLRDTPPVNAAIYHPDTGGAHHDALLVGSLQRSDECITVIAERQVWTPIFPSDDVRLRHDAVVYQGTEYRSGEEISLGGGEANVAPPGARIPKGCPTESLWLVAP